MKKFISMVMAAAMVVSLVPATAFAADVTATAKVVNAWDRTKDFGGTVDGTSVPEVQVTVTSADEQITTGKAPVRTFKVVLDNAEFTANPIVTVEDEDGASLSFTEKTTTTYKFGAKMDAAAVAAAIEDVIVNDKDTKYPWVAAGFANTAKDSTALHAGNYDYMDQAWIEANADYAANVTEGEDKAWADFYAKKANFNVVGPTVTSVAGLQYVYDYNAATKTFVKVQGAVEFAGFDATVTLAQVAAAADKTVDAYVTTANWDAMATAALAAVGSSWELVTEKVEVAKAPTAANTRLTAVAVRDADDYNVAEITVTGWMAKGDVISIDLASALKNPAKNAYVSVESDDIDVALDKEVYVAIVGKVLKGSVKKLVDVAEEEKATIKPLTIEAKVGALPETVTLKLNKGFEFVNKGAVTTGTATGIDLEDDDEIEITGVEGNKIIVTGISIEATSAKPGDVAVIKVVAPKYESASVEVAKVCEYKVVMSVDEDQDVPVFYNGTDVANTDLNDDSDHMSLEVTIKETFRGAWDMDKKWTLSLPEGVYVTNVDVKAEEGAVDDAYDVFKAAYIKGEHVDFEFGKRVFDETDPDNTVSMVDNLAEVNKVSFELELIAAPTFVGDVVLTLEGAAVDTQEVVIAKVLAPYTVAAEQNDVIIDYRYTSIDTDVVITEAEAGLWKEGLFFALAVERADMIQFEDEATFTVNAESDMELEVDTDIKKGTLEFTVTEESEEAAAEVVISNIELFMQRNIPAGPYALELSNTAEIAFDEMPLLGQDLYECKHGKVAADCDMAADVADYSDVVKEAWVNVVTAGRDKDDASFTTKVLVPVGESYLVAGETQHALDVPAYINAAGYTMLPVRAVAVALGIDNDAVQWDNDTKTVIIMYGQRVITMTAGQKVIYASGTAIPAKSAVEIVDGRAFLGLRDLGTALGVTKVDYDAATKTATLN